MIGVNYDFDLLVSPANQILKQVQTLNNTKSSSLHLTPTTIAIKIAILSDVNSQAKAIIASTNTLSSFVE